MYTYCRVEWNKTPDVAPSIARLDHRKSKFGLRHVVKLTELYYMTKSEFWFSMIPPSYRGGNVRSWSDPVVVPSDPRGRAARAMHDFFFSKIYEIPRVTAARKRCASSVPVNSTVGESRTSRRFQIWSQIWQGVTMKNIDFLYSILVSSRYRLNSTFWDLPASP